MLIPLVTRELIDDIVATQARNNGDASASPRPLGATIGLVAGFLAMMVACNILSVHSMRMGNLLGCKTRGAVSLSKAPQSGMR
jgi:hypothetical protein